MAELIISTLSRTKPLGDLFGIFFEDLNHAADGGLYAELVRNRSFEFDRIDHPDFHGMTGWEKVERGDSRAQCYVETHTPLNGNNPHYLVMEVLCAGEGGGVRNAGYGDGIPVKAGGRYYFSCYARLIGSADATLEARLESAEGAALAETELRLAGGAWTRYEAELEARESGTARLCLTAKSKVTLALDMVSLFPADTFRGRRNGLRRDIAELLEDMRPKFMRFPGGCLVHCGTLDARDRGSMYRWKNTVGPLESRPSKRNSWGYNQSFGLGFYEYFLFCEDIGAEPLPVIPAGFDPHEGRAVPLNEMEEWIADALDLIEFANAGPETRWGQVRAEMGHSGPFNLKYLAIGNEEVGDEFFERYALIHARVRAEHPEIKLINSAGPFADGASYCQGWESARANGSDFIDEHYYQSPEWFAANMRRYDNFDPFGPKVFLGEYASWGNTWYNALVESAYMTGLQNAPAVGLACYAPLLCRADSVNWKPDLIWFDDARTFSTANYHVQKLFMRHQGDWLLPARLTGAAVEPEEPAAPITGRISLVAAGPEVMYTDIELVNHAADEIKKFPNAVLRKGADSIDLGVIDCASYTLRFRARRLAVDGAGSRGGRGFEAVFGRRDEKNYFSWRIGGWQNQDSILESRINGRGSCLTQSLFTVAAGREYQCELTVEGLEITAFIDGQLMNRATDKLPVTEPLYYTASLETSSGDIILKAANLNAEPLAADIVLKGMENRAMAGWVYELAGYDLNAENSFDEPEKITPAVRDFEIKGSTFAYSFPGFSFTVIRLRK
ncbi:MAG: alpha-L-arabinofuranosidase [Clostridiales bacterium]|jgi:alpha-L-arabinofuranosidase|nr:alpha-L-arabinofuranosidase [Clostridiales bacterium]